MRRFLAKLGIGPAIGLLLLLLFFEFLEKLAHDIAIVDRIRILRLHFERFLVVLERVFPRMLAPLPEISYRQKR